MSNLSPCCSVTPHQDRTLCTQTSGCSNVPTLSLRFGDDAKLTIFAPNPGALGVTEHVVLEDRLTAFTDTCRQLGTGWMAVQQNDLTWSQASNSPFHALCPARRDILQLPRAVSAHACYAERQLETRAGPGKEA